MADCDTFILNKLVSESNQYGTESNYYSRTVKTSHGQYPMSLSLAAPELELFKGNRIKEKTEMKELNTRLANYIEVTRDSSAFNIELTQQLEDAKNSIRKETIIIKEMYDAEMGQLQNILDDTERDKNEVMLTADNNGKQCDELTKRINEFETYEAKDVCKIKELDALLSRSDIKLNNLSTKILFLNNEKDKDEESIKKLRLDLEIAKNELNNESLIRSDTQNRCQSINEKLDFTKDIHQKELKNLMSIANYDPINQSKEWWNDEFSSCIKEIQNEYETRLTDIRFEMESHLNNKVEEVVSCSLQSALNSNSLDQFSMLNSSNSELESQKYEINQKNAMLKEQNEQLSKAIKNLQSQYNQLLVEKDNEMEEIRKHFESALAELQIIIDNNLSLQLEIMSYRKLLEYEEARVGIMSANVEDTIQNEEYNQFAEPTVQEKPKVERKYSYQRSSKGSIAISDCRSNGTCIVIYNMDQFDSQNLEGWKIIQSVDKVEENEYVFDLYFLGPGETVKIWAMGVGTRESNDLVWEDETCLAVGDNVLTVLLNQKGKEKSTYTQKAVYKV